MIVLVPVPPSVRGTFCGEMLTVKYPRYPEAALRETVPANPAKLARFNAVLSEVVVEIVS